jgi:signal transduction histidine kinase
LRHSKEAPERYQTALQEYLAHGGQAALERADELGREALQEGLGVLDVAALHHRALAAILQAKETAEHNASALEAMASFFAKALWPFEMDRRGYRDAYHAWAHMNQVMELEAKRIAHALHDESAQLLAVLRLDLDDIERDLSPSLGTRLGVVYQRLDQVEKQLRQLSHDLRPPLLDDLGLGPAMRFLAEEVAKRTGLEITVEASTHGSLPPAVEMALYRVAEEGLANVARHAKAQRVTLSLRLAGKTVHCSVEDNGIGFDYSAALAKGTGWGVRGIRERIRALGGTFDIQSSLGHGTALRVEVPLQV